MDSVRANLEQHGHPPHRYHQESFGGAPAAPRESLTPNATAPVAPVTPIPSGPVVAAPSSSSMSASAASSDKAAAVSVQFAKSGKTVQCGADDYLLDLAEEHGVEIDSSCRAGNCGSCKVKKFEGEVDMEGQQALSESDIADGYVLCCIGKALGSKLVLDA